MANVMTKSNLGRITTVVHPEGRSDNNPEAGTGAAAMEEHYLLACSSTFLHSLQTCIEIVLPTMS